MENTDVFLGLHDFLERMRQPSAADFVKSIKSFIVSFSNNAPDPERDSALVQSFLANMEAAFRAHPLWAGCSEEELESAGEGLEKYVMTKLFPRVFASVPDDIKADEQLSEKISLVQQFVRPEYLDIKAPFQNETSWLLAQKELQKINMYKAPRDKLVCVLNCCKVINNLLLNASIASNEDPPGADEFLPVLIYVTIKLVTFQELCKSEYLGESVCTPLEIGSVSKANPPQLHSNLLYVQRYRCQYRLVGEIAYFFTNMLSAESFISNIDANSLSMDEAEFEKNMKLARALLSGPSTDMDVVSNQGYQNVGDNLKSEPVEPRHQAMSSKKERDSSNMLKSSETRSPSKVKQHAKYEPSMPKILSFSDIENRGATMLLKEDSVSMVFREYPYLFANAGDLTINDVEELLNHYKQLVFKYACLSKGLGDSSTCLPVSFSQTHLHHDAEPLNAHQDTGTLELNNDSQKDTGLSDSADAVPVVSEENVESKSSGDHEIVHQKEQEGETSA